MTTATTYPPHVLDLTFRASIERSHYDRPTKYVAFEPPVEFRKQMQDFSDIGYRTPGDIDVVAASDVLGSLDCEWVVVQRNYQKYPSGGESHYASYSYWNGERLETAQGNGRIQWLDVQFYRVSRLYRVSRPEK